MPSQPRKAPSSRLEACTDQAPRWGVLRWKCVHAAQRLGSGPIDAEDLAQEAMARLLSAEAAVERPEAWLRTVVANLFRRLKRRRAAHGSVEAELTGPHREVSSPAASPAARVDVERALALVSPRTRRLLQLVLAGLTHREIAAVLECEVHQVGPRIQRALKAARRRLTKVP